MAAAEGEDGEDDDEEEEGGISFDDVPPDVAKPCLDLGSHELKIDHFEQMHELGKENYLKGAPNFRQVLHLIMCSRMIA